MEENYGHASVLLEEALDALAPRPGGVYLDGTLGRAGHSLALLCRCPHIRLIGVDRDRAAITAAEERLAPFADRVTLVHDTFDRLPQILAAAGVSAVDGMLFDLGVSSPQLDDAQRGFSYMREAPLDMRMDASAPLTAAQVVNTYPKEELRRILQTYGEERYAAAIAARIVARRAQKPFSTTLELVEAIKSAMPPAALREKQHPAKRSFQAIRVAVNDELGCVERMLAGAPEALATGGRLAVISFHSLEDRLVKRAMAEWAKGCICPPDLPVCACGRKPVMRLVSRKSILPGQEELEKNPRSRSAKLRVAEKL